MNSDKFIDLLRENLDKELEAFRKSYDEFSIIQTYNDWYTIGFYESYYDVLTSDYAKDRLDSEAFEWLSSKENPLCFLYNEWISCDGELSLDWDDMVNWVNSVYSEEKHLEKQKLYNQINSLELKAVSASKEEYFANNFDAYVNKEFAEIFRKNLLVKCCNYGCDIYPGGISQAVEGFGVYKFQPQVWNFIDKVEKLFDCKCCFDKSTNNFNFVFEFGNDDKKGCYVIGSGNNGQEYSVCLYLTDWKLIRNPDVINTLTTIDKALYSLLEEHGLRVEKARVPSLEDNILRTEKTFAGANSNDKLVVEKNIER